MFSQTSSRRRRAIARNASGGGAGLALLEDLDGEVAEDSEIGAFSLFPTASGSSDSDLATPDSSSPITAGPVAAPSSIVGPIEAELLLPDSSARPLRMFVSGPGYGREKEITISEPTTLCGRGSQCDLVLRHADVSHRHAMFQRVGNKLLFVDLCSRLGISRNGEKRSLGWLAPGDELKIGPYTLRRAETPTGPRPEEQSATPEQLFRRQSIPFVASTGVGLRIAGRPGGKTIDMPLERPITIAGRASSCKLRLHDESVSRMHAGILLSREGVFAVDLQRRSGLAVNGRTVKRARLEIGDELQIGRYRLRLIDGIGSVAKKAPAIEASSVAEPNGSLTGRLASVPDDTTPVGARPDASPRCPKQERASTDENRESTRLVSVAEPRVLSVAPTEAQPSIGDALGFAIFGALADLQQQFEQFQRDQQERTQQQMEMMLRAMESSRTDLRDEIVSELKALRLIADELQIAQQAALIDRRTTSALQSDAQAETLTAQEPTAVIAESPGEPAIAASETIEAASPIDTVSSDDGISPEGVADDSAGDSFGVNDSDATESPLQPSESSAEATPLIPAPTSRKPGPNAGAAPIDSLDLAQRIAKLQRERASRWERLMQLISGAG